MSEYRWQSELSNFQDIGANYLVAHIPRYLEDELLSRISSLGYRMDIERACHDSNPEGQAWKSIRDWCITPWVGPDTMYEDPSPNVIDWGNWKDTLRKRMDETIALYGDDPSVLTFYAGHEVDMYPAWNRSEVRMCNYKFAAEYFNSRISDATKKLYFVGQTQTGTFDLDEFLDRVPARMFCMEPGYPFRPYTKVDSTIQQRELDSMRTSLDDGLRIFKYRPVEMWACLQAHGCDTGDWRMRVPSRHEIRVQAYMSLSRGAKGLNWFVYGSTTPNSGQDGFQGIVSLPDTVTHIRSGDYSSNNLLTSVRLVHEELAPLTQTVRKLFVRNAITSYIDPPSNSADIVRVRGPRVEAGTFKKFYWGDSTDYILLVNRLINVDFDSLRHIQSPTFTVRGGRRFLRDVRTGMVSFGTWYPNGDSTVFSDTLEAGGGELYHLKQTLEGTQDSSGRLHELEIVTGTWTIDSGYTVKAMPGTTIIFQPGTEIVVRKGARLEIDTGAVIDLTGGTLICEGDTCGSVIVHRDDGIRGRGTIENGRIEWKKGWTVAAGDSIGFAGGALLEFPCNDAGSDTNGVSIAKILGVVTFEGDACPYRFGYCLDTILVGAWDGSLASRFEARDGATLEHVPYIHAAPGALLYSRGVDEAPCRWLFRSRASCVATGHIEADFTEFGRSNFDAAGADGWNGIIVAYAESHIDLDECLVHKVRTTADSGGYGVHLYESYNQDNIIKRTRILRLLEDGDEGQGSGVFLQYGQGPSFLRIECCQVGDTWWTGVSIATSEADLIRNIIEGNRLGVEEQLYAVGNLFDNRIRNARNVDIGYVTGAGVLGNMSAIWLGDSRTGAPGRNLVLNNEFSQVYINHFSSLSAGAQIELYPPLAGRNQIVSETGAWRLWIDSTSTAESCNNWYGWAPDSTDGNFCLFGSLSADSLFYVDPEAYWLDYNPSLCDTTLTTAAECTIGSIGSLGGTSFSKTSAGPTISTATTIFDLKYLAHDNNFHEAYRFLGTVAQYARQKPARFLAALGTLLKHEREHLLRHPDSAGVILSRFTQFVEAQLSQNQDASLRAGMLSLMAGVYSFAGDAANSDAAIAQLSTMAPGSSFMAESYPLAIQNALARNDTTSAQSLLSASSSCAVSPDATRLGWELLRGYLRVPRRETISALSKRTRTAPYFEVLRGRPLPEGTVSATSYPDPFTGEVTIRYRIVQDASVRIAVYSPLGEVVAILKDGPVTKGEHAAVFRAPAILPTGVYYYVVTTDLGRAAGRITLVR